VEGHVYKIAPLCRLLGISRWGYYKHDEKEDEEAILITSVVLYCNYIRAPDNLPKAGCRELLVLCKQYFGVKFTLGRDRFYDVLRANGLMLRRKRYRPRTTDSKHNNRIYPDLLNTTPKLVAKHAGQLVVADITYVYCSEGFGYLSLLTDAYSRYIVGWCFHETLETEGPAQALAMAVECYARFGIDIVGMIHHSDRGVQYTSCDYVKMLAGIKAQISMTQTGAPLHNALAERMNNTVKNSWLFNNGELDFISAGGSISNAIYMYNHARPHQALDMKTPSEMMTGYSDNPLLKAVIWQEGKGEKATTEQDV
jgi:transposase InsO family protein